MKTTARFTDIGKLIKRLQELTEKFDAQLEEIKLLKKSIVSLWLQNKAILRNLLNAHKRDELKIQEYQAREQILKNAKHLCNHRKLF